MIYLLKFIGLSLLLYGVYHFVLRNEKTFRFNRFYLLAILFIAATIPLVIVRTTIVEIPVAEPITFSPSLAESSSLYEYSEPIDAQRQPLTIDWEQVGFIFYGIISLILLSRFILNLASLYRLKRSSLIKIQEGTLLAINDQVKTTFTFFNHIFINQKEYETVGLEDQIFTHEKAHIKQKHSIDIVLIEILNCFLWFNPVIYWIKKSIKLNHEFLADEGVLQHTNDPANYQKLILKYSGRQLILNPLLASHLTFGETKKRFTIMFKTTNKKVAVLKQVAALLSVFTLVFLFGQEKVMAQKVDPIAEWVKVKFINEQDELIEKTYGELTEEQKEFVQNRNSNAQMFLPPATSKEVTLKMMSEWKDSQTFGIWIDENKVENEELQNYSPSEFRHYQKFPVLKNWEDYQNYDFRVYLTTKSYFESLPNSIGQWLPFSKEFIPRASEKEALPVIKEIPSQPQKVQSPVIVNNAKVRFIYDNGDTIYSTYSELENEEFKKQGLQRKIEVLYPPTEKKDIDRTMLDDFKDPKKYGVWIDGKRIENEKLSIYSPSDFHHYDKSRLLPNAKNYGKHDFQINLTTNKAWEASPNKDGTWLPLIKEIKVKEKPRVKEKNKEKNKEKPQIKEVKQKQDGMPLPPAPPKPFKVELKDNTPVQYKDAKGKTIETTFSNLEDAERVRFESVAGKGQVWVSLRGRRPINNILIQNLNHPKIKINLNGKEVEWEDFKDIDIVDIHHYTPITKLDASKPKRDNLDGYIYSFITEDFAKENPKYAGEWIDYESRFKNLAQSKTKNEDEYKLPFQGYDLKKVENFRVPTLSTHVKFLDKNKKVKKAVWRDLTEDEKELWFTKDHEGMIFSPPEAKMETSYTLFHEIANSNHTVVYIDGVEFSSEKMTEIRPHQIYNYELSKNSDGSSTYRFTTDLIFLDDQWDEEMWISNVIYKAEE